MSALSSVLVRFSVDTSEFSRGLQSSMRDIGAASAEFQRGGGIMGGAIKNMASVALTALGAVGGALGGISAWKGVEFNAQLEQAEVSFGTLLGSAEAAKIMIADLQKFGAETPFEFMGLQESAKLMLAMGTKAKDVMPNMQAIGDAVSAIGGGEDVLKGVTMALGQMSTKGKVSAEEMNQLAERGIPAWDLMAQKMGMSKQELMELSSQGKILADQAVPALIASMGEKYAGSMGEQAETYSGMVSTLKDNLDMMLGSVVKPLFEGLKDLLKPAIELVSTFSKGFDEGGLEGALKAVFSESTADTIISVKDAVVGVINFIKDNAGIIIPLIAGIGAGLLAFEVITVVMAAYSAVMAIAAAGTLATLSPIILVAAAIGALVAIGLLLWANWDQISAWLVNEWKYIKTVATDVWNGIATFFVGVWQDIVDACVGAWNGVTRWLANNWNYIKQVATDVWGSIVNFFTTKWESIKTAFTNGIASVKSFFADGLNSMKSSASSIWETIVSFFTNAPAKISGAMSNIGKTIKDAWSGMISGAGEMGGNLIKGFMNGVLNLGSWLKNKIGSFFQDNVIGKAKDILGIHSPSRVMKEFGKYTAQGLSIGIENHASEAEKSAARMAQSVVDTVGGSTIIPSFANGIIAPKFNAAEFVGADSRNGASNQGNAAGDIHIAQLVVREEADINKIAELLYQKQQRGRRAGGRG